MRGTLSIDRAPPNLATFCVNCTFSKDKAYGYYGNIKLIMFMAPPWPYGQEFPMNFESFISIYGLKAVDIAPP